jgi:hypothetical protein
MTMTLIQHQELGSAQSTITFSSIPQTYTDLKLVLCLRGSLNNPQIGHLIRFNGDTGANYQSRWANGTGSGTGSASITDTFIYSGQAPALTATSNTFGNTSTYIPNYTGSGQKVVNVDATRETNGTSVWLGLVSGLWTGTAAITQIDIVCEVSNWVQYGSATLYGITKGSNGVTVS